jgi:iron complex outermembrane recepter protein
MKSHYHPGVSLACFGALLSMPVYAQEGPTAANEAVLDEIVVTAQKRVERLQDIPFSIAAISGEVLEQRSLTTASDLQFAVPGLSFTGAGVVPSISGFNIRGIGTNSFSNSIESSVSMVVDGVALIRQGAGLMDLNDLERVEVLRGPQGTLFGKNASAGVISFVTKAPTPELSAGGGVSYGNFNALKLNGFVSGPLVKDKVFVRLSGYKNSRDGFVLNKFNDNMINNADEFGLRLRLRVEPSERLTINVGADFAESDADCCVQTTRSYGAGVFGNLLPPPFQVHAALLAETAAGIVAGPKNREVITNTPNFSKQRARGVNAQFDLETGIGMLTSLTAYRKWSPSDGGDFDQTPLSIFSDNSNSSENAQFSQELRLGSVGENRFNYTIGAFYLNYDNSTVFTQAGTLGLDLLPPIFPPPLSFFFPTPPGTKVFRQSTVTASGENVAGFGEVNYKITDKFNVFGGVRVLWESQDVSVLRTVNAVSIALSPVIGASWTPTAGTLSARQSDSAVSWRIGADFKASDDFMFFGSVSRGYKGAGFNTGVDTVALRPVAPEVPTSFEIGLKSSFFDRKLTINATAFTTEFKDFQAEAFVADPVTGINVFAITNAGSLRTKGIELEIAARPISGLSLGLGANLLDATYSSFVNAPCYPGQTAAQGCVTVAPNVSVQDLTGKPLSNAPRWKINLNGRYEFALSASNEFVGFVQGSYAWRSESIVSATNDPSARISSYGLLDASIGVNIRERLELSVFGKNIANNYFDDLIFSAPFDFGGYTNFPSFAALRTYGVALRAKF